MKRTRRRHFLAAVGSTSIVFAGCSSGGNDAADGTSEDLTDDLPRKLLVRGGTSWPQYGGSPANNNTSGAETLDPPSELWTLSDITEDALGVTHESVLSGGQTVFASIEGPNGPTVGAYKLETGERKWYLSGNVETVTQMPAIGSGGTAYVTDGTTVADVSHESGETVSSVSLSEEGALTEPLTLFVGDNVSRHAYGGSGQSIYKLDPLLGIDWTSDLTPTHERGSLPMTTNYLVAVSGGQVAGLSLEEGTAEWTYDAVPPRRDTEDDPEPIDIAITPTTTTVVGDTAVAVDSGTPGTAHGITTSDGSRKWRVEFDESIPVRAATTANTTFVATESSVYAIDAASGELLKRYPVTSPPVRTPPMVALKTIIVGESDAVRGYNITDGSLTFEISTTPRKFSNVALTGQYDGPRQLFVIDTDDTLHVYGSANDS